MTLDELRGRLREVAEAELPEPQHLPWEYAMDSHYFYHSREFVKGYQTCARDFLYAIKREGLVR